MTSKENINVSRMQDMQDSADKIMSDAKSKAKTIVDEVSDTASNLYSQAEELLEGNGTKIATAAAVVLAAGVVGFMIGRGSREEPGFFSRKS